MKLLSILVSLIVVSVASLTVLADDIGVAWKTVPAAVQKALRERYPIPEIIGIDKEGDGADATFEFELKEQGHEFVAEFTPAGKFVKQEDQIEE